MTSERDKTTEADSAADGDAQPVQPGAADDGRLLALVDIYINMSVILCTGKPLLCTPLLSMLLAASCSGSDILDITINSRV